MSPNTIRSKACTQCRERRVKCDETPECCKQCSRLRLKCSGPIQGSVIIDMTNKISKPKKRKKKESKPELPPPEVLSKPRSLAARPKEPPRYDTAVQRRDGNAQLPSPPVSNNSKPEDNPAYALIQHQYQLPIVYEPSNVEIYDQAFVAHFVELTKGLRPNQEPGLRWIDLLPQLLSVSTQPAFKYCIRAASMAFYARMHRDMVVQTDSYRWYITGLNRQRAALAKLDGSSLPSEEDVIVPVILALYEVFSGTTPASIFHHLTAAAKILEMRGPRHCSTGIAHELFKPIRAIDSTICVIFNKPSRFATPEWTTIPFLMQPKQSLHLLTDIILNIPHCTALSGLQCTLKTFFTQPIPFGMGRIACQAEAFNLLKQLNEWWKGFEHIYKYSTTNIRRIGDAEETTSDTTSPPDGEELLTFNDTLIALTTSTYYAARLTILQIIHKTSSPTSPIALDSTSQSLAKSIIQIAKFLESTRPVGFDFMRSVFPLVAVAVLGPGAEYKALALDTLTRWGSRRGLHGLCSAWVNVESGETMKFAEDVGEFKRPYP